MLVSATLACRGGGSAATDGGAERPAGGGGSGGAASGAGGSGAGNAGAGGGAGTGLGGAGGGGTGTGGTGTGTGGSGAGGAGGGGMTGNPPVIDVGGSMLKIEFCAPDVVRVAYAASAAFFTRSSLATAPKRCEPTSWTMTGGGAGAPTTFTTSKLSVRVDASGAVTFLDLTGQVILAEKATAGRTLTPATIQGEATSNVRQEWQPTAGESLYGLGQHQQGLMNIKDWDLDLRQYNTEVFIPYLVSSRGYGVLWDNTSYTRFGDLGAAVPIPGLTGLYATGGTTVAGDVNPGANGTVNFTGTVTPAATGDYTFRTYSSGTIQLSVNNQVVIDHYRQGWLPSEDLARVRLTAGQAVPIRLQWTSEGDVDIVRLLWKPPVANRTTSLWSKVGDGVDYYLVYGPELDTVVAGYRRLTGEAPLMPRWAFGLWQCRERYQTAQEVLDVLSGYRTRGAPVDNVVQDWQYWLPTQWGSHAFDPARYPNPAAWITTIHDTHHARLMISVWPKFYTNAVANYTALNAGGFMYRKTDTKLDFVGYPFSFYDAFSAAGRQLYWSQINTQLFSKGVDAWWMDATEPEVVEGPFTSVAAQIATNEANMHPTALGTGSRMLNAYSLVNSQAVFEGQRAAAPNQRVFILTRNGFAGQQRYAAATWSGDITSTWTAMRKQIPAGLSFSVSGMPYWTLDSGGFSVPARFRATPAPEEWNELNTRWFEFATFLPLLRIHGQAMTGEGHPREIWQFGGNASPSYAAMLKFDKLRYRLLPYIYALAGGVTRRAGTILRPLVMDFRNDATAREIGDQYMFGPAFLVSPVTTNLARTRSVYLPATTGGWYDFWTGTAAAGGATVQAAAAYDAIPVHVRAGSIVPFGPDLQYTSEKAADPLTIYVYAGADGSFTLYEDQGLTNDYQQGAFSEIPLAWNNATRTLTIGARAGTFTGMLASRAVQVVLVAAGKAVAYPSSAATPPAPDRTVTYTGAAMDVVLN